MPAPLQPWSSTSYDIRANGVSVPESTITYAPRETFTNVSEVTTDAGRWYSYENIFYPSITTMIKATDFEGTKALQEWRERVGTEAATRITTTSAAKGTRWHRFSELFFMKKPTWPCLTDVKDVPYGATLGHLLNEKIETVIASESRVISPRYGLAGRVDVGVKLHDGRSAIIDFKTGRREKSGNRLENYFIQTTFYADALTDVWEDETIDTVIIVQLLPNSIVWQESHVDHWRPKLTAKIEHYAHILNESMETTPK